MGFAADAVEVAVLQLIGIEQVAVPDARRVIADAQVARRVAHHAGGERPDPPEGLLTTVAWGVDGRVDYALEAAVFVTGAAVQWLRDGLGIIDEAAETEALAAGLDTNDGVYFVPALTGLGSPWWDPYARVSIVGTSSGTPSYGSGKNSGVGRIIRAFRGTSRPKARRS